MCFYHSASIVFSRYSTRCRRDFIFVISRSNRLTSFYPNCRLVVCPLPHFSIFYVATSPIVFAPRVNKSPNNDVPIDPRVPSNDAIINKKYFL